MDEDYQNLPWVMALAVALLTALFIAPRLEVILMVLFVLALFYPHSTSSPVQHEVHF